MAGCFKKACVAVFVAGTFTILKWNLRVEVTWNGRHSSVQEVLVSPVQRVRNNSTSPPREVQTFRGNLSNTSEAFSEDDVATTTNLHIQPEIIHHYRPVHLPGSSMKEFINASVLSDLPIYMGFQPNYEAEFPSVPSAEIRIPHMIHQIWIDPKNKKAGVTVPTVFVPKIRSMMKFHSGWKYTFWTHTHGKNLIKKKYPKLLKVYNRAHEAVTKADLLRYVVIHEYGGVYVDLDVTCLRNINIVTKKYACILVPAPFENSVMDLGWPNHICNGIILCRAHHPFFRQVLDSIASVDIDQMHTLSFGPQFFTQVYRKYSGINDMYKIDIKINSTSPYFYKGNIPENDRNGMYIPNTRYFLDQPAPRLENLISNMCGTQKKLNDLKERVCHILRTRGFHRKPGRYTFFTHSYTATFHAENKNKLRSLTSVFDIMHPINKQNLKHNVIK
ncbi:SUR1-like protein [Mya arenaria]|uniref:SUR1-like protein n=1 Tax=Mya arenaria TaxID=6604 RepID=A0ABY7GD09_MYAAR|nr:SUR1-like protein [Mya arenaria]